MKQKKNVIIQKYLQECFKQETQRIIKKKLEEENIKNEKMISTHFETNKSHIPMTGEIQMIIEDKIKEQFRQIQTQLRVTDERDWQDQQKMIEYIRNMKIYNDNKPQT